MCAFLVQKWEHQLFIPQLLVIFSPPSLSLPSEQRVSMATSHPTPLHPDWQRQCHPFWSRMHLPLLLHSPGQLSTGTNSSVIHTDQSAAYDVSKGGRTHYKELQKHTGENTVIVFQSVKRLKLDILKTSDRTRGQL